MKRKRPAKGSAPPPAAPANGLNSEKRLTIVMLYYAVFIAVWTAWTVWGLPMANKGTENETLRLLIHNGAAKNIIWTIPALMIMGIFKDDLYISVREMFRCKGKTKNSLIISIPLFLIMTAYILFVSYRKNGGLSISEGFQINSLIAVLFVGITEETVFRGWMLNMASTPKNTFMPSLINSLLFLAVHFPKWICDDVFFKNFTNLGFLTILLLGFLFGQLFLKCRSILVPIFFHMYYDLLVYLFI